MALLLTCAYGFCASHRLHAATLSTADNQALYGKCNNPNGHGHNYRLEVTLTGPVHPVTGMLVDLTALNAWVEALTEQLDHMHLNHDVPFLAEINPTTENVVFAIGQQLLATQAQYLHQWPQARLHQLVLHESANNSASVHY